MVGMSHGVGWHVSWARNVRANRRVSVWKRNREDGIGQDSSIMWGEPGKAE